MDNLREIVVKGNWDELDIDWFKPKENNPFTAFKSKLTGFQSIMTRGYNAIQDNKAFQKIVQTKDVDLVIVDAILNDFVLPIVDLLRVPWIYLCIPSVIPWHFHVMNVDQQSASIPGGGEGVNRQSLSQFLNRLHNTAYFKLFSFFRDFTILSALDELVKRDYPNARPIAEIQREASLSIINYHPATAWPRPLPPTVISIGPLHTRPALPLPQVTRIFEKITILLLLPDFT